MKYHGKQIRVLAQSWNIKTGWEEKAYAAASEKFIATNILYIAREEMFYGHTKALWWYHQNQTTILTL